MNPNEMNPQDLAKLQDTVARQMGTDQGTQEQPTQVGIKDKIRALEDEIRGLPRDASSSENLKTYLDEYGQETYYVRNISGTHVCISDINMDPIQKGKSVDLTELASMEDLKKSRDLKNATNKFNKNRLLERLSPQEYYDDKQRELDNQKKIAILRDQMEIQAQQQAARLAADPFASPPTSSPASADRQKVRAEIHAKLGKLSLLESKDPEKFSQALTPVEFIEWVFGSTLNSTEIEFILGDPVVSKNSDIKTALLQKRATLPS